MNVGNVRTIPFYGYDFKSYDLSLVADDLYVAVHPVDIRGRSPAQSSLGSMHNASFIQVSCVMRTRACDKHRVVGCSCSKNHLQKPFCRNNVGCRHWELQSVMDAGYVDGAMQRGAIFASSHSTSLYPVDYPWIKIKKTRQVLFCSCPSLLLYGKPFSSSCDYISCPLFSLVLS